MKIYNKYFKFCYILTILAIASCTKIPTKSPQPITNFDVNRYLGTWYEIARTDNRFERNCINASANYSLREDGGINVVNKCILNSKEKTAIGKAYFKNEKNIGSLKVTFFWPFYGDYNIIYLDSSYQNAIIYGGNKDYIWILSRHKKINQKTLNILKTKIENNGLDSNTLIYNN